MNLYWVITIGNWSWVIAITFCGLAVFFNLRARRYNRQSSAIRRLMEQVDREEIGPDEADRRLEAIMGKHPR